jgi:hypothetical protein
MLALGGMAIAPGGPWADIESTLPRVGIDRASMGLLFLGLGAYGGKLLILALSFFQSSVFFVFRVVHHG